MASVDPQDIASEEALLGALLTSPSVAKKVQVDAGEFYKSRHGLIWDAAIKCAHNGGADTITVAAELERRGQLAEIGGKDRLLALAATVPAPRNAGAYAKRVKEKAQLRTQRRAAKLLLDGVDSEDQAQIAEATRTLGTPIRFVDVSSGELVETCPTCEETKGAYEELQNKYKGLLGENSRLKGKQEAEAKKHKLWPEIEYCFSLYKLATAHFGVTFTAEEFKQALPRWKQYGKGRANPCKAALKAICGIAYDPSSTKGRAGKLRVFDKWELMVRNQFSWPDFHERTPGVPDHEGTCECDECDRIWWNCLVDLIEGNLK